jgi:hypothetical protein
MGGNVNGGHTDGGVIVTDGAWSFDVAAVVIIGGSSGGASTFDPSGPGPHGPAWAVHGNEGPVSGRWKAFTAGLFSLRLDLSRMVALTHSAHLLRCRPCSQKLAALHARQVHRSRPCWQIDTPPHSRQRDRRRLCGQMDEPPQSRHSQRRRP